MKTDIPILSSTKTAARYLGMSVRHAKRTIEQHGGKPHEIRGHHYYSAADLKRVKKLLSRKKLQEKG